MSKVEKTLPLPQIERVDLNDWLPVWFKAAEQVKADASVFECCLTEEQQAAGVHVLSFEEARKRHADSFARVYRKLIPKDKDQLSAFHHQHLEHSLFIYIPPATELKEALNITIHPQASGQDVAFSQLVLYVGANSHVDVIEYLRGEAEGDSLSHLVYLNETYVAEGASLKYATQETLAQNTRNYVQRAAHVDKEARLEYAVASLNDGHLISEMNTRLIGSAAEALLGMIGISTETTEQIVQTNLVNDAPHSKGEIIQHGVILDQARLSLNSVGKIERYAKQADAQQESRILMLTEEARGDANPILLIEEYEVTAGHAASVGQVDEEQLYYLMSRGISRKYAEYLVIRGFLGPVMLNMPSKETQSELLQQIDHKLAALSR